VIIQFKSDVVHNKYGVATLTLSDTFSYVYGDALKATFFGIMTIVVACLFWWSLELCWIFI